MNKESILKILKSKKEAYHLKNFILFGSVASNEHTEKSDVDIAYIEHTQERLNFATYLKLESELENLFKTKIDLINYKKFNPLIKLHSKSNFIYV